MTESSPEASPNVRWHASRVPPEARARVAGQRGGVAWFTGLSGAGKSTLATAVEAALVGEGRLAFVLDGDNVRHGLCGDLGFAPADRDENIRRVSHVAGLLADAGAIVLAAFVSPTRAQRARAREVVGPDRFVEVHVAASLEVCEGRDTKGLYARARRGEIPDFTGVSAPYEEPEDPEVRVDTGAMAEAEAVAEILEAFAGHAYLGPGGS